MGFRMDCDKFDVNYHESFLRFVSNNDPNVIWVWFKDTSDVDNIFRGEYIRQKHKK